MRVRVETRPIWLSQLLSTGRSKQTRVNLTPAWAEQNLKTAGGKNKQQRELRLPHPPASCRLLQQERSFEDGPSFATSLPAYHRSWRYWLAGRRHRGEAVTLSRQRRFRGRFEAVITCVEQTKPTPGQVGLYPSFPRLPHQKTPPPPSRTPKSLQPQPGAPCQNLLVIILLLFPGSHGN